MIISTHKLAHFQDLVLVYFWTNIEDIFFEDCLLNIYLQISIVDIFKNSKPCIATNKIAFDFSYGGVDDRRPDAKGYSKWSDYTVILEP